MKAKAHSARADLVTSVSAYRNAAAANRRAITLSVMLLLGCAALAALVGDSSSSNPSALESSPYPHDSRWLVGSGPAQLAAPAQQDEAKWRKMISDYFGNWEAATSSNADPNRDGYRGGGDGRVGAYKAPALESPEGDLLPSAAATQAQWNQQIAAMQSKEVSDNSAILDTVGSESWKARGPAQPWMPTVMIKRPRSGEFKSGELNTANLPAIGERGAAFLGLSASLPPFQSSAVLTTPQ